MTVTLPPQIEQQIQDWIERGSFPDAAAVIQGALEALEAQEETARSMRLRELVRAGFESGEAVELTDDVWDEIDRKADEAFARGEVPPPHVCP